MNDIDWKTGYPIWNCSRCGWSGTGSEGCGTHACVSWYDATATNEAIVAMPALSIEILREAARAAIQRAYTP